MKDATPTTVYSSCRNGQKAVSSGVPNKGSRQHIPSLVSYTLPDQAIQHNRRKDGIAVYKVNKNGKLQSRRLSFTPDRRALLVSTQKIKSWRGLWQRSGGSLLSTNSSSDNASYSSSFEHGNNNNNNNVGGDCKVIPLLHIDRIQLGMHTARFAKARETNPDQLLQSAMANGGGGAFSIIYELYDDWNHVTSLESLDIVVPKKADCELLEGALETLSSLVRQQMRQAVSEVQFLRYHWSLLAKNTHKPFEVPLSAHEWMVLTDHIGLRLPKPKLQQLFSRQISKQKGYNNSSSRGHDSSGLVDWAKISYLIQKAYRMQGTEADDPIVDIWKDLLETDPVPIITLDDSASFDSYELNVQSAEESISPVAFMVFLRDQQGESEWTLEQVTDTIHALNTYSIPTDESFEALEDRASSPPLAPHLTSSDDAIASGDRLCYERFRHYMLSGSNDLLLTTRPQDMNQPLSHYYVCSSHDTYLASLPDSWETTNHYSGTSNGTENHHNHHSGNSRRKSTESPAPTGVPTMMDAQNYLQALIRGVRCLEMTIWNSPNGQYPVLDRTGAALGPPLDSVWDAIVHFISKYDPQTFPIIVRIENHCSTAVQNVLANQINTKLRDVVFRPRLSLDSSRFTLPSPQEARGKVILMAKRPQSMSDTPTANKSNSLYHVMHDDYDDENEIWDYVRTPEEVKSFDELNQIKSMPVVSFDTDGPIYAKNPNTMTRTATQLVEQADVALSQAQREASEAKMRSVNYEKAMENAKRDVENMAMKAGCTYDQIVREVSTSANGRDRAYHEEEKSPKDEGIEIHEVLLSSRGHEALSRAKQNVAKANENVQRAQARVRVTTKDWKQLQEKSESDLSQEDAIFTESKKARSEATVHREHAKAATERFRKVQNLVEQNNEFSSSAETVVVTALTEAKISEKRASEAEARASRASATATKDRARAEAETNKEEELEQEVNEAAERCARSSDALQASRVELDKVNVQIKRLQDQIRLIEQSSQYKTELRSGEVPSSARHGGSFVEKHASKVSEMEKSEVTAHKLVEHIRQFEAEQNRLQKDFEEYNHLWKVQADIAAKVRKVADRSAHIAEELAEHAEEEREAANLRRTAHQRAEANVAKKGSQKESLYTQLEQAKRAMEEANALADQSKKRADKLAADAARISGGNKLRRELSTKEKAMNDAKTALERAIAEKTRYEEEIRHEQRRLQITEEVSRAAQHDKETQGSKIQVVGMYHEKAVKMFKESLVLKAESDEAVRVSRAAQANVDTKAQIARRAREHKMTKDRVTQIPHTLASATLLHTLKHAHWEKSIKMSSAHVHSIAYHVLQRMVESQPDDQVNYIQKFTEEHLCRIFPSWNAIHTETGSNYDPLFPWKLGCQIVPMNYHSSDENLLVNEGFFRQNSSCGYVLKSPKLLGIRAVEATERWKISILSGYSLPLPKRSTGRLQSLRPVVKITVHVGDVASAPYVFETGHAKVPGPNPMYEKETCQIVVTEPSIAMIAITVWDKQQGSARNFIAGASIPVSRLRQGYRSVLLFDSNHSRVGPYEFASLFVHAEKERSFMT